MRFNDASVGRVTEWTWDWGDGTQSSGADQAHTWSTPNTYRVTLTVRNQYGADSATKTIQIVAKVEPPKALFDFSPKAPIAGNPVQFTDLSSGGPSSWTWDFGDGSGSVGRSPSHQYSEAKTYTVKLTVRNAKGTSEVSQQVPVGAAAVKPEARMTVSDRSVEVNQKVTFTLQRHDRQPDVADLDHRRRSHRDRSDGRVVLAGAGELPGDAHRPQRRR